MAKRSAGLLLWRRTSDGVEVLLGHPGGPLFARKDDGVWTIPKGEYDEVEDRLAAAYREFAEEIGVAPPDGEPKALGEVTQRGGKLVTVWALEGELDATAMVSNLFAMEWPPRSGRLQEFPELDRAGWFALDAARAKVFASQLPFLDRLAELVA